MLGKIPLMNSSMGFFLYNTEPSFYPPGIPLHQPQIFVVTAFVNLLGTAQSATIHKLSEW